MSKSVLLRRIIALPLIAVLLSGILSAGIYILFSRWTYAGIRAGELVPVARRIAEMVAEGQPEQIDMGNILHMLDRDNKLFGALLHVFGADGSVLIGPPDARPRGEPGAEHAFDGAFGPRRGDLSPDEMLSLINGDLQAVLTGTELSETRTNQGQAYLVVGVPVRNGDIITGAVVLTRPMREIDDTMRELNLVLVVSAAAAFLIMLIPAYFAARRLVVPIRQMHEVALAMAKGDFTLRADESPKGELGELARAMNHFAVESGRLEQTRRDYVANVSHELRTPIASVRAMGETLRDGMARTDEKKMLFYNNIVRESMRLSRLVDDLLELSRLQAGTEAMQKTHFDLREILQNVSDIYGQRAAQTEIAFTVAADISKPIQVYSNLDRVEQVLVILLDNAEKHTPAGGEIKLAVTPAAGKIEVAVENNGEAIPPEDLPYLFERFYKVDKSHSGGGTGLGLSIANEIMKGLGETIYAETVEGGVRFAFTLAV
jgi:signal transduction histidine kinase